MTFFHDALNYSTLSTVKALPPHLLRDGQLFSVLDADGAGKPSWYVYKAGDATPTNEPQIASLDNVGGRLIAVGLGAPGGTGPGGGGGGSAMPGYFTCSEQAPYYPSGSEKVTLSGKAIRVLKSGTYDLNITVSDLIAPKIVPDPKAIEVHRWSQIPNTSHVNRQWVADLPETGGTASVTIDGTYQWISVYARNVDEYNNIRYDGGTDSGGYDGVHDGAYLLWNGTTDIQLWTFASNLNLGDEYFGTFN